MLNLIVTQKMGYFGGHILRGILWMPTDFSDTRGMMDRKRKRRQKK